jgi:hypothetical protein
MEVIFLFAVVQLNQLYSGLQLINQPTVQSTFLLIISTPRLTMSCMPKHRNAKHRNAKLGINDGISYFHNMSGWCFGYYY